MLIVCVKLAIVIANLAMEEKEICAPPLKFFSYIHKNESFDKYFYSQT